MSTLRQRAKGTLAAMPLTALHMGMPVPIAQNSKRLRRPKEGTIASALEWHRAARKRRLAKVAAATEAVEAAILTLRRLQLRHHCPAPADIQTAQDKRRALEAEATVQRLANDDLRDLYYLSRLARQAP